MRRIPGRRWRSTVAPSVDRVEPVHLHAGVRALAAHDEAVLREPDARQQPGQVGGLRAVAGHRRASIAAHQTRVTARIAVHLFRCSKVSHELGPRSERNATPHEGRRGWSARHNVRPHVIRIPSRQRREAECLCDLIRVWCEVRELGGQLLNIGRFTCFVAKEPV